MSIATKDELRAAIKDWLARADLDNGRVDDFIRLAEADMGRRLRLRLLEASEDLTINAEQVAIPFGLKAVRSLYLDTTPRVYLTYRDPAQFHGFVARTSSGKPRYYTVAGLFFRFAPVPDESYTGKLLYSKLPSIDTNTALLSAHPDMYLFGALAHAEGYIQNDERMPIWRATYEGALAEAQRADRLDEVSGSGWRHGRRFSRRRIGAGAGRCRSFRSGLGGRISPTSKTLARG